QALQPPGDGRAAGSGDAGDREAGRATLLLEGGQRATEMAAGILRIGQPHRLADPEIAVLLLQRHLQRAGRIEPVEVHRQRFGQPIALEYAIAVEAGGEAGACEGDAWVFRAIAGEIE